MLGSTPSVAALFVTLHDSYSLQFRVALLPTRTLSCTYVLDCNRGTNKPSDDDDDDDDEWRMTSPNLSAASCDLDLDL